MTLPALLLPLLLQSAVAPPAPADVGWVIDPSGMDEVVAADGVSRVFYPKGQSAADWRERFTIQRLGPATTHAQAMAAQEAQRLAACPAFSSKPLPGAAGDEATLHMWNCPADNDGHGTTAFAKTLLAKGNAYLATAEKRGKPVAAGKVQSITSEDIGRYAAFVMSLDACTSLTVPGCAPFAAIMGEYGDAVFTADDRVAIDRVAKRGLALYRQDQLAWHATDYALARKLISDKTFSGGFFSVAQEGQRGSTYFVSAAHGGKERVVRIDSDGSGNLSGQELQGGLPQELQPRWAAVQTAKADPRLKRCGPRINTAVLPNDAGDGWLVYVMSATADERQVFLGGHNRFEIDATGKEIRGLEHSAKSCIAFDAARLRGMKRQEGFFMSHLVSAYPWETDVMQSLTFAVPLTRIASSGIWRIEGDAIRKLAATPASP